MRKTAHILVNTENSVLIVAEFFAANWQRNFAPRKGQPKIRLSEKTDLFAVGARWKHSVSIQTVKRW